MVQRSSIFPDNGRWVKSTFIVNLGDPFESYADAIRWSSEDKIFGTDGSLGVHPQIQEILDAGGGKSKDSPTPVYFSRKKCRDTSLGGNDAINPYYQYCENDDVMHPLFETSFGNSGMGRVYSQNIDDNQQILYMSCGLPEYNSATGFYSNAIVPQLANWMNNGARMTPTELGTLVGVAAGTFILLPVIPLIYLYRAVNSLTSVPITKYFDLRPEMPMYYRFVNSIMITLAVNMGFAKDGRVLSRDQSDITGSKTSDSTYNDLYRQAVEDLKSAADAEQRGEGDEVGLPDVFTDAGWDIYRIMLRRYRYEENLSLLSAKYSTDQAIKDGKKANPVDNTVDPWAEDSTIVDKLKYWWNDYADAFKSGLYDANLFVGFRVEKSVDTSESISNSTGQNPVAQQLNAKYEAAQNIKSTLMRGSFVGGQIGTAVEEIIQGLSNVVSGVASTFGVQGISEAVLGSGRIDIPEAWTDSSFSKNYSFNLALRSPYGDPMSIYQSIYVPLALILGASLPRAVGAASYTSPFLVRAYCKGMLGIPLGIIDSVTIKRGSDQHGWNSARLPTAIDVSFTIKDLSPAMYMSMSDSERIWDVVTGENSTFQEYLSTLSGLGLNERLRWMYKVRRKAEILLHSVYANRLSPAAWGMGTTTSTQFGRIVQAVAPRVLLPNN